MTHRFSILCIRLQRIKIQNFVGIQYICNLYMPSLDAYLIGYFFDREQRSKVIKDFFFFLFLLLAWWKHEQKRSISNKKCLQRVCIIALWLYIALSRGHRSKFIWSCYKCKMFSFTFLFAWDKNVKQKEQHDKK